jgi:hypothetical protein
MIILTCTSCTSNTGDCVNCTSICDFSLDATTYIKENSIEQMDEKPKQPDIWKKKYKRSVPEWKR